MNKFTFLNRSFDLFQHPHNCGNIKERMTERSVELSIADYWINNSKNIIEIGAVIPYYWPNRIEKVVDPSDRNPLVTERKSFLDIDVKEFSCLSISTFEHIGMGDYGLTRDSSLVIKAFKKLFDECGKFLITVPTGYNNVCDRFLTELNLDDVKVNCLERGEIGNDWHEIAPKIIPYGTSFSKNSRHDWSKNWANGVLIVTRNWNG